MSFKSTYNIDLCLEVCVDSIESALNAVEGGADRLELCTSLSEGGLTPTVAFLRIVKQNVQIPVFCMVRPRNGPMIYSELEQELMVNEAKNLKEARADGLVFGALMQDGTVNQQFCRRVMKVVDGLPCTFHRAFDQTIDLLRELDVLIDIGFQRVLTSGGKSTAIDGASMLKDLNELSKGRITILAGAGVRSSNCMELVRFTGVKEIHSSAKVKKFFPYHQTNEAKMGYKEDEEYIFVASVEEIRLMKSELKRLIS